MKCLVGIDIGTSGTKSVLFDTDGNVVKSAYAEYAMYQPKNGWAEQDPNDWWRAVCNTLKQITSDIGNVEICSIGLSGQMHGLVMLDENDRVIRNCIIWCDGRCAEECSEVELAVGKEKLIEITGNPALAGFTASKIMWVKKHEPENFERCRHILLPKDYIRLKLTGEYATEVSDASGTQLLDIKNRCWSTQVCQKLGIDTSILSKVYESPEITGFITDKASSLTGIKKGIPVVGGGGDNAAAAIGTGVYKNGNLFTTIGTSGVVYAHTDMPVIDSLNRVHTFCCAVPGKWHIMGVTQAACLSLNWFKNNIANELTYREMDEISENIPIGSQKLIYLPYLMGERTPILDSNARGMFFGLSAIHTKAHMARAVMEGVSFSLCNCLDVINEMGIVPDETAICGGGGKSPFWRQMVSDIFMLPVKTLKTDEGPALGAAILAGCGGGIFRDIEDGCKKMVHEKETVMPIISNHAEYMKYYEIYNSIYPEIKNVFTKLGCI